MNHVNVRKAKAKPWTGRSYGLEERVARAVLNNIVVELIIIIIVSVCYLATRAVDSLFKTRLRRGFVDWMQSISRDGLNVFRRAQIKYVFKRKYGLHKIRIRLAGGSYWMSIPCIVKGYTKREEVKRYLAKIINDRSALKQRYLTRLRNLGVLAEGADIRFHELPDARAMGEFERESLQSLRAAGVSAPEVYGLHKLGGGDYMLVMEYITGEPLSKVDIDGHVLDQIFRMLKAMHDAGIFHGDVKLDNFMLSNGRVYVFDCAEVEKVNVRDAEAFDLACMITALAQKAPMDMIMAHARRDYSDEAISRAAKLIDIALNKADLDLSDEKIREIKAYMQDLA